MSTDPASEMLHPGWRDYVEAMHADGLGHLVAVVDFARRRSDNDMPGRLREAG
jgi:hypothetical protein